MKTRTMIDYVDGPDVRAALDQAEAWAVARPDQVAQLSELYRRRREQERARGSFPLRADVLRQRKEQCLLDATTWRQKANELIAQATQAEKLAESITLILDQPGIYVMDETGEVAPQPVRSLSVKEMLDGYADQHGDIVRVAEAATAFVKAGYWSTKRSARNTLHSTLRHFAMKGSYQKIGRGVFRRVPSVALNGPL